MGEGMVISIDSAVAANDNNNNNETTVAKLMLLFKILHQVLILNCPTVTASGVESTSDTDKCEKSSQLRIKLSEITIMKLWKALSTSLPNKVTNEPTKEQYMTEIKDMMDQWKEHNVFGGPTILDEYKRGWSRALKEAAADAKTVKEESKPIEEDKTATKAAEADGHAGGSTATPADQATEQPSAAKEDDNSKNERETMDEEAANDNSVDKKQDANNDDNSKAAVKTPSSTVQGGGSGNGYSPSLRRASSSGVAAEVEIYFEAEGVPEAKVEPSQFLDACKVIASIQITRDLGSDAAMNISSALSNVPVEVEEACNTILTEQANGESEKSITELLSPDTLSTLPDELLDMDLKYAKQSLQTYKEAIRQQRKARLQCLHLLLQSRCSFGSMDAARSFCGGEGSKVNMDDAMEKLKKRKEILVDALALEGLDVDEDAEEKKNMEKEEQELKPLSWFPGQQSESEEGPATKKPKVDDNIVA